MDEQLAPPPALCEAPPGSAPDEVRHEVRDQGDGAPAGLDLAAASRALERMAAHHGEALIGPALGPVVAEGQRVVRYHRNVVLEWTADGGVRPRPLGALAFGEPIGPAASKPARPTIVDLTAALPSHPTERYPRRPLAQLRTLVLHHSGADPRIDAQAIAREHVSVNGWPGIGYHYCIDPDGLIVQGQDLTVSSFHVAQFNPVAVGVALLGDLRAQPPPAPQLAACAALLAWLCADLGLPSQAVRGHGELVATDCPGGTFAATWRAELLAELRRMLRTSASANPA